MLGCGDGRCGVELSRLQVSSRNKSVENDRLPNFVHICSRDSRIFMMMRFIGREQSCENNIKTGESGDSAFKIQIFRPSILKMFL